MHIGVFSYYYLPVVNGVTITIADWKRVGEMSGTRFTVCIPNLGKGANTDSDVIEYPAVQLYKRFGITVPMFPELFIEKEFRNRHIDVLHAHHPFYIGKLALLMKQKLGIPLVFTYHTRYEDYFTSYFPWMSGRVLADIVTAMVVRFMNRCDAVTVANEALKQELFRKGVRSPVFIVPPGIDTDMFAKGSRDTARQKLGLSPADKVLLYVGRLAKEKNIYFLMRAFTHIHAKMPDVKLVLAGNGLEEERLIKYARKLRCTKQIIFATRETVKTIPDIYAAADIFVYASQTETYGRVIVEAMSAGLPIVALAGPSIVDLLQDGINGRLVFRRSPHIFAAQAAGILNNPDKAASLGLQAQKDARKQFDNSISWSKLLGVYAIVAGKS